ncbi:MAG: hypothetical protein ABWZ83_05350 [Mesorhizobium sp.]
MGRQSRFDVKFNESFSAFVMARLKDDDDGEPLRAVGRRLGDLTGFTAKVSPKATINTQITYTDSEDFIAVANVMYELVPG